MDTLEQSVLRNTPENDASMGMHRIEKPVDEDVESGALHHIEEDPTPDVPPLKGLSFLDRFLVVWILLAMALGIILGNLVPSTGPALQRGQFVGVSVPIAVGLLVMMYPILCKVRFETLHLLLRERSLWIQMAMSFVMNWIFCPLLMVGLAWAFLPDRQDLREGLIFVGIARCIAMVLIWTDLAKGDGDYCAVLVAFNSILQIVLFAPFAVFYIKIVSHDNQELNVKYDNVARSVAVFLGIPLAAAIITRLTLRSLLGERKYQTYFIRFIAPWSLIGLIFTIIVLFASQGQHVVHQITSVLRVAAPLIVYFAIVFTVTVMLCRKFGFGYRVSCTQSFTAASNNFELAIAVVVAVYGAGSGQALASTVGPLIEVPVLVGLVYRPHLNTPPPGPRTPLDDSLQHEWKFSSASVFGLPMPRKIEYLLLTQPSSLLSTSHSTNMAFLLHLHNPFPSFSSSNASPVLDLNFTNRQLVSDLHECYSDLKSVFHQLASAPDDALAREMIFEEIGEANVKMVCGRAREETWDDVLILWDIMKGAGLDGAIYDHEHRARRADRGIAADVVTKPEMESGVKVHQVADALRSIDTLISTAATERT